MNKDIQKYRKRRSVRLRRRFDEKNFVIKMECGNFNEDAYNEDVNVRVAYGIAKGMGIDTAGMSPKEVYEAIKKNGGNPYGKSGGKLNKKVNRYPNRHITAEQSGKMKVVGGYNRKNKFKNGYGVTGYDENDANADSGATMKKYTDKNGNWTEEREAMHSKIIDDTFKGKNKAKGKPRTIFMGGGPASGKSWVAKNLKSDMGLPNEEDMIRIDPDACKKPLPEYDPRNPNDVHEESSALAKRITQISQENGYNSLVDGTGDGSVEKMRKKIKQAKAAGNVVEGRYVFMPVEDALDLNQKRERSVGSRMLVDTHKKISKILPEIAKDFDDVKLYANVIGGKPKLIAYGGGGKDLTIVDKELYQKFLDNGNFEYDEDKVNYIENKAREKYGKA